MYCDIHYNTEWDTDIGNYGNLIIKFENDLRYQKDVVVSTDSQTYQYQDTSWIDGQ